MLIVLPLSLGPPPHRSGANLILILDENTFLKNPRAAHALRPISPWRAYAPKNRFFTVFPRSSQDVERKRLGVEIPTPSFEISPKAFLSSEKILS
jgi:hypothetical protein